jgi:hypothetical protein
MCRFSLRKLLIAVTLIAIILGVVNYTVLVASRPNFREATFPKKAVFMGHLPKGPKGKAVYFSVRIGDGAISVDGGIPINLRVRNQEYALSTLSFEDVKQMGGEVTNPNYVQNPSRTRHGFVGWGVQNRDGALEFSFTKGKLTEFYARWHTSEPSPFALIPSSRTPLNFPFSDVELQKAVGKPTRIIDTRIK